MSLTEETDQNVFMNKEYVYGVDYRAAFGYTFPQLAFRSELALDDANFDAAIQSMAELTAWDGERKLEIKPTHLVCGYSNRAAANALLKAQFINGGDTNTNAEAVELIVSPFLP